MTPDKLINDGDRAKIAQYCRSVFESEIEHRKLVIEKVFEAALEYAKTKYGTREQGIAECLALLEGDEAKEKFQTDNYFSVTKWSVKIAAWLREKLGVEK